jgi:uncharacterized MAPEG superfamily protein
MMNDLNEMLPHLVAYQPTLLALALLCVSVLVQSLLTAPLAFIKGAQSPGMPLKGDHTDFSFRVLRTYVNSVESLGPFGLSVLLAVMLTLDPVVVNWLAGLHVAFRLGFWAVYYSGVGKVAGGPRTLTFVGGMLTNLGLAGYALFTLIGRV